MVPKEREIGGEGHPTIAQFLVGVSNYMQRSDSSEGAEVKGGTGSH